MSKALHSHLNFRNFAIATLVPIAVMFVSMFLKPLWRDEYWSLFFADRSLDIAALAGDRWRDEVHPPLYYVFLYYWQGFAQSVFAQRCLSIIFLGLTAFGVLKLTPKAEKRFTYIFLLICAGSYWVIYFASEVRPYVLLFCLATFLTFLTWRMLEEGWASAEKLCAWVLTGCAIGVTHYFGALWFACLGFCLGVSFLKSGDKGGFFVIGGLTALAMLPVVLWLSWSLPVMDLTDEVSARGFGEQLGFTLNQYFRGLLVKTFGSNPLITFLGFGALIAAVKGENRTHSVLLYAVILMTVLAFVLHFTFVELIKERAFSPQMPAMLFILARGISMQTSRLLKYVPIVTAVMPLLFASEYFKDREKIEGLQARISPYAAQCEGQDVLTYYRDIPQTEFIPFATKKIINFSKGDVHFSANFIDAASVTTLPQTQCPLKAIALVMPKNSGKDLAIATFTAAGLDVSDLTEIEYGKARYIIWIEE